MTATPASRAPLFRAIFVLSVVAVCLIRLAGFVADNAVDLLFDDQWDALRPLFENRGPWNAFFMQHGPPRLGLGGLIDWFLYDATNWDVRAESWAGVIVLALTTVTALALAVRLRGHLAWSDAAFPLLLLSTVHWETLLLTPFLAAKILPLLLTLLLALIWSANISRLQTAGLAVFGILTLFTGYGFCGFPVTVALALLLAWRASAETSSHRAKLIPLLLLFAAAVVVFASTYQWSTGTSDWRFPVPNWWDYPRFCALMFTSLLGWRANTFSSAALGAVVLILVIAAFLAAARLIWRGQSTPRTRAVWILAGTSLTYSALTAIGRLPTNLEAAFLWRYTTLMMPALCGLALAAEGWAQSRSRPWRAGVGVAWLALAATVWSNFTPESYAATIAQGKRQWISSYLATHDLKAANQASGYWVYFPEPDSPVIAEKLRWLEQRHFSFFRDASARK